MSSFIVPGQPGSAATGSPRTPRLAFVAGMMLGALSSAPVFAGGADVSSDEIYSDGLTLMTEDGQPLDINGDGDIDLAVASNRGGGAERSRYYLGNGDGTFSGSVLLTAGASSQIAAADLNADTFVDLVQGRRDLTEQLHLNNGAGGFFPGSDVTVDTTRTLDVVMGDLDNDGDMDIVTGNGRLGGSTANPPQPNRFYLNDNIPNGTTNFSSAEISADADDTRSVALVDIDGDGDLDVIAGNDETTPNSNRIYLNQFIGSGVVSFAAGIDFGTADDQTSKILIGDLNNDGIPDIVALNHVALPESPGINRFYLNASAGGILVLGPEMDVSADTDNTGGGVLADFDGDGDLDLAVYNLLAADPSQSSRSRLYLNQFVGSGIVSFAPAIDISDDEQMSRSMAAADLNGDGHIDIIVGNQDDVVGVSGRDRRYLNNGTADPFTNIAPVIDSQTGALDTNEETALLIEIGDVEVTDPDNVFPIDFTLTVQAGDNYTFMDNTITPDAGFDGDLAVSVIVNDGTDDSDAFDLTVTVNNTLNTAPSFTSSPITVAAEGVAYSYNVTTTDLDPSDSVTITAPTVPAWLTFTDNGDGTASLSGTPDAGDVGEHDVILEASDGVLATPQAFTITVNAASGGNTPPEFDSTPITDATEGEVYTYNVTTSDADADALSINEADTLPGWLDLTDNGDGTATLTGTPAAGDVGDHDISLEVSDGTDTGTQNFTITVAGAGPPPTFPPPTFGGGGGSFGLFSLLLLAMFRTRGLGGSRAGLPLVR